jgi:hypothetical protein
MTLRWAERSNKYFEEHKHEVPWASNAHVGTAALGCPVERSSTTGKLRQYWIAGS